MFLGWDSWCLTRSLALRSDRRRRKEEESNDVCLDREPVLEGHTRALSTDIRLRVKWNIVSLDMKQLHSCWFSCFNDRLSCLVGQSNNWYKFKVTVYLLLISLMKWYYKCLLCHFILHLHRFGLICNTFYFTIIILLVVVLCSAASDLTTIMPTLVIWHVTFVLLMLTLCHIPLFFWCYVSVSP